MKAGRCNVHYNSQSRFFVHQPKSLLLKSVLSGCTRKHTKSVQVSHSSTNMSATISSDAHFLKFLGLEPTASASAVQTAYKQLALKHHPDKVDREFEAEATARFQEINQAY